MVPRGLYPSGDSKEREIMAKKKIENKTMFTIVTADKEGPKETEWRRLAVILYEDDKEPRIFIPYTGNPDNRLVSGAAFKKGDAFAVLDERPYVDVDFIIATFEELKKDKDADTFRVIKANIMNHREKDETIKTDTK